MLKLRQGVVVGEDPLTIDLDGERRVAWADEALVGEVRIGDAVVVNVEAVDLGLGSGGFDIVHVNLTRGTGAAGSEDDHVLKLNYTSCQHPVAPVERGTDESGAGRSIPVLVAPLHGHLAPSAFAVARAREGWRLGYVQAGGGALPGRFSRDVIELRERGLLCDHVTAGPSYGGEREAMTVAGALDAGAERFGWDAAIVAPGPGIIGSGTRLGHGGMAALDGAHASLSLGMRTVISPRLSEGDPRPRHRGLSHHTATVLGMLLAPVEVAIPTGAAEVRERLDSLPGRAAHVVIEVEVNLDDYAASGLPCRTMGRDLDQDRLFFAAPLAAGAALAAE